MTHPFVSPIQKHVACLTEPHFSWLYFLWEVTLRLILLLWVMMTHSNSGAKSMTMVSTEFTHLNAPIDVFR